MKSIATPQQDKNEISFPCLMITKTHMTIVLFTEPNVGVVVYQNATGHIVGVCKNQWDMSLFEYYNGSVTLSNDKD